MSQFIMVAPEGWVELDTEYYENNTELTKPLLEYGNTTSILEIATKAMIEHSDLKESQTLAEIRLIDGNFWVLIQG